MKPTDQTKIKRTGLAFRRLREARLRLNALTRILLREKDDPFAPLLKMVISDEKDNLNKEN
jgi:hypothetical protein